MNAKTPKLQTPRKLLVAAIGVATINYVAVGCGKTGVTSGNLPAPDPPDAHAVPVVGNLPAPEPIDAAPPPEPSARDASTIPPTSGNLPAPVPRDAGPAPKKK